MARLTALSTLYTMLMARIGADTSFTGTKSRYYQLLSDKQKWLANEYDFPFLEDRFDVACAGGSRYVSFPTIDNAGVTVAMNLERPYKVEVFWNNVWSELEYGIGSEEFNYLNSDQAGNAQDPIQRWRWSSEGKFEVWPVNNTAQAVRFTGQRALDTLVADSDTCDLDDLTIVLFVAADILIKGKQADGPGTLAAAQERLARQRGAYPGRPKGLVFGGCEDTNRERRVKLIPIAVAGN
jgi:hypothetical protein